MTGSPISDLNPVFMAVSSKLTLMSKGKRNTFYLLIFEFKDQRLTDWIFAQQLSSILRKETEKLTCSYVSTVLSCSINVIYFLG